mmetsp:Transcript_11859/g.8642  ORF Transcript_11859/g.8642 Transcript_11859/m.8642 type:complete len:155 (+) Transcript_11859:734-1198(+)|eukprot:CAMPEP_0202962804 /NCGR_PEP_ID=MMETSP1396-20130829/6854_1 /ASSEMBLY_ACC=CAM_ASM_000872 /TAXON_ID= /ORGANISM="Pseudokeronopsis sp., Strain Brazil" /LENGTH=154 /DNA_ID=CAMNT_0049683577 /DNA_START=655 /DNA_END=1119 /DNA_ORIENTATION=-
MQQLNSQRQYTLKHTVQGHDTGSLSVEGLQVVVKPSFLDYLRAGWGMSLICAIDFTASNGEISDPSSLHYLNQFNQYESAIVQVGAILKDYDTDQMFPVYGFGGVPRFMGQAQVNHCFPLNGNYNNPEVMGIDGILKTYREKLQGIGLYGPTYF